MGVVLFGVYLLATLVHGVSNFKNKPKEAESLQQVCTNSMHLSSFPLSKSCQGRMTCLCRAPTNIGMSSVHLLPGPLALSLSQRDI